jgi:hypothetical protein
MTAQALIDQWRLHPDPEVGSCANQLAGWLRTQIAPVVIAPDLAAALLLKLKDECEAQHDHEPVRGSRTPVRDFPLQPGIARRWLRTRACAGRHRRMKAMLSASRGGGDTRPPLEEEKADGIR